jgi:hypothetical protein
MIEIVKKPVTLFSFALLLVVLVPVSLRLARLGAAAAASPPATMSMPTSADVASTMIRAGLSAEALTAAGVTAQQVDGVVAAFQSAVAASPQLLPTADAAYAAAKTESDRLRRLIESGQSGEVSQYQSQVQALATAMAERQSALDTFTSSAVAGLTQTQRTDLTALQGNRDWEVPLEFEIVERTEQEWVALRKALDNEKVCAKYGTAPSVSQQALLATLRANQKVALAKANLETNGSAVEAAWTSAATGN